MHMFRAGRGGGLRWTLLFCMATVWRLNGQSDNDAGARSLRKLGGEMKVMLVYSLAGVRWYFPQGL
jgi:hypothetical protein